MVMMMRRRERNWELGQAERAASRRKSQSRGGVRRAAPPCLRSGLIYSSCATLHTARCCAMPWVGPHWRCNILACHPRTDDGWVAAAATGPTRRAARTWAFLLVGLALDEILVVSLDTVRERADRPRQTEAGRELLTFGYSPTPAQARVSLVISSIGTSYPGSI